MAERQATAAPPDIFMFGAGGRVEWVGVGVHADNYYALLVCYTDVTLGHVIDKKGMLLS